MIGQHGLSERRACQLVNISRTGYRYVAIPSLDTALRERLLALATKYPRYGYLMLHSLLKSEGWVINKKRTYRIYTEEGLQVRTKRRKKLYRPFRVLNIIDDHSRELVGQLVSVSISGMMVARFLTEIKASRYLPKSIVTDNGAEFTSKAMFEWSKDSDVKLAFIQPGKLTQNTFVESLNRKFRNECLNQNWFRSMEEARWEIGTWREHYNNVRPHSSLQYMPPVAFANKAA